MVGVGRGEPGLGLFLFSPVSPTRSSRPQAFVERDAGRVEASMDAEERSGRRRAVRLWAALEQEQRMEEAVRQVRGTGALGSALGGGHGEVVPLPWQVAFRMRSPAVCLVPAVGAAAGGEALRGLFVLVRPKRAEPGGSCSWSRRRGRRQSWRG